MYIIKKYLEKFFDSRTADYWFFEDKFKFNKFQVEFKSFEQISFVKNDFD